MQPSKLVIRAKGGYQIRCQGDVYQVFFGRHRPSSTPMFTTRYRYRAVDWRDQRIAQFTTLVKNAVRAAQPNYTFDRDKIPPCAASMGCLCAGHARGNAADAPCDTTE